MTTAVTTACALLLAAASCAAWHGLGHLDNTLGDAMPADPRPSLRDRIRVYLGTDLLPRMEQNMADWITVLNGLVEQTTAASAAQATSFTNLQNAINRQGADIAELRRLLDEAVTSQGTVTPEMQEKVNAISQSLADMKAAADTADNGFEPVEPLTPGASGQPAEQPQGPTGEPTNVPATPDDTTPPTDEPTSRR